MARRRDSGSSIGWILVLVALVMLVLAIVGVCIDWFSYESLLGDGGYALGDMKDTMDKLGELTGDIGTKFNTMLSFAILTVILAAATTVFTGICKVLHWKLFRFILVIVSIVCVVCAVVAIIMTYSYIDATADIYTPAAGMWLTTIGGILCGVIGVVASVRK